MPKRILLADDSITIQKVVELTFSDGDYEIVSANNGVRALQKLAESMPDIILSDIIMPEKNGYEVCEFVKSHPEYRDIPVILLTGTFEPFDPDRAEKAGCDAVVTKPFESQSLINKVEELIQKRQSRAEESRAARGDDFVNQPLDSFVGAPAAEQEAPPAQPGQLGATMAWQMPTVADGSSEPAAPLDSDSPFSAEDSSPPAMEPQEDSPFGSDSGWQPIAPPEHAAQEMPGEPFDAGPPTEDAAVSEGFNGESIFAPEDTGTEPPNEAGERANVNDMSEPPPLEDSPAETSEENGDAADSGPTDDLSTRAWAVPIDGAWAEADVEPDAESENTLPFPGFAGDAGGESSEAERNPADTPPLYQPSVSDELQNSPWGDDSGSTPPAEQTQDETEIAAESPVLQDVWAVEPADAYDSPEEPAAHEMTPAEPEPEPRSTPAWEPRGDDMSAQQNDAAPEQDVPAATEAGRTLTDEDVERIARRVVELMSGETVKNIAWEVVPDIAEMVVRERVRELEEE